MTELRFPSPGWKFYGQGITLSVFGVVLAAWGIVTIAVDPWNWVGVISMLGGGISVVAGAGILLLVWFLYVYGVITSWRDWRQFRPPTVIINSSGAHYRAPRRPVVVEWADIEQVRVNRTIFPKKNVTKVSLQLMPGAALIREGRVRVPASRYLNVGLLSDLTVPEEQAMTFLEETAGTQLELSETDRRPQSTASRR